MKYECPKTIKAAAEILDKAMPGWEKKIDKKTLDMDDGEYCVLGQLYFTYDDGIDLLFDNGIVCDRYDKVFGIHASRATWIKQINLRLNPKVVKQPIKVGDWTKVYVNNQHITVRVLKDNKYLTDDFRVLTQNEVSFSKPKSKFGELKIGQKFIYRDKEFIKGCQVPTVNSFCITNSTFHYFLQTHEVTLV